MHTEQLEQAVKKEQEFISSIYTEMEKVLVGQRHLVERLLLALCANGHVLIEGIPGLGKTLAVKTFSSIIQAKFQRVQFTPDILPADLTGAPIYIQQTGTFQLQKGPLFTNILLADEINRAPAKVQSALLEVMEERQITIAQTTYPLDEPFMVLATQNPIEQDGTYDLPESQLDRFLLKIRLSYPSRNDERTILRARAVTQEEQKPRALINAEHILKMRQIVNAIAVEAKAEEYILNIIEATRHPDRYKMAELKETIAYGCSPRATLNLTVAAKTHAMLQGRHYVTPADIQNVAVDVLSHRIIVHTRGAHGINKEEILQRIVDRLEIP